MVAMRTADIVIIGGGVIGSACAYFLARQTPGPTRIIVLEPDPTYGSAATPRSAGGIRQQFSIPENIRMSRFAADFLNQAAELLAVGDDKPALHFQQAGYLFLASPDGETTLRAQHHLQIAEGAAIDWLDPMALQSRFPWLSVENVAAGTLGLVGEGWIDPYVLLQAFRRKSIDLGVTYVAERCVGLRRQGDRIAAVLLANGEAIACDIVINAAGYRAAEIAHMADLSLPVHPRKRCIFVFDCRTSLPRCPLVIDPSGVWFRPEGSGFITGVSPPEDQDPDALDFDIVHAQFDELIWPALASRVPAFEAIKLTGAWAGHYDVNIIDHNAIVGTHPSVANLLFACGFSGHGLQQSPAIGRAIAELALTGGFQTLDLSRLSFARILQGTPLREANVV